MNISTEIKTFNFNVGLKVGVISDSQLPPFSGSKGGAYKKNLLLSLEGLKKAGCNFIIFAGDIGNLSSRFALKTYKGALDSVYKDCPVITQTVMGNHDYYSPFRTPEMCRKLFSSVFSQSPYTHYVVNGFHFIGASPDCSSMTDGYSKMLPWLKEQIEIAVKDSKTKPIFVTTHNSALNTVYGSDDWGDKGIYDLFKNHPNIVNLSGHLHYSLLDERSFHQNDYTTLGTQSISYTEMEKGKANGTVPPNAYMTPMGYIFDFREKDIVVRRMNFLNGIEEKAGRQPHIPYSVTKADLKSDLFNDTLPSMPSKTGEFKILANNITALCFDAGTDNDFIHSYKILYNDGTEQLYFSDFYNGIENMQKKVILPLYAKAAGMYNIKVFALNSYGRVSENCTEINNVEIKKETRYWKKYSPEIKSL